MFLLVLPQLRSPYDQSTDRKLLRVDSPFQCGLKSAKKRYCLLSWESGQPLKAVYSKFCCLSRMYPRQQYSANMVWRRRECTRCTAFHLDRPYLIIYVGCVMSKLRTSRSEKKNQEGRFLPSLLGNPVFFSCASLAQLRRRRLQLVSNFSFNLAPLSCLRERWENGKRTEVSVTVTKGVAYKGGYASTFLLVWSTFFIIFSTYSSFWVEGMMLQLKLYVCTSLSSEPPIFKNLFY